MLDTNTVVLGLVLATPFALAIHDEVTMDRPDEQEIAYMSMTGASEFGGGFEDLFREPTYSNWDESRVGFDEPRGVRMTLSADERHRLLEKAFDAIDDLPDHDGVTGGALEGIATGEPARGGESAGPPSAPSLSAEALAQLFGDQRGTMGPALAAVRIGMTADQVRKQAPEVAAWSERSDELGRVVLSLEYLATGETELSRVILEVEDASGEIENYLLAHWGEPQIEALRDIDNNAPIMWIREDGHLRAAMWVAANGHTRVSFTRVMPIRELLSVSNGQLFSFETGRSLIGATVDELKTAYPRVVVEPFYQERASLDIPVLQSAHAARAFTRVSMKLKSATVRELTMKLSCGTSCDLVVAAFDKRFGKPARSLVGADAGTVTYKTASQQRLSLSRSADDAHTVVVKVQP